MKKLSELYRRYVYVQCFVQRQLGLLVPRPKLMNCWWMLFLIVSALGTPAMAGTIFSCGGSGSAWTATSGQPCYTTTSGNPGNFQLRNGNGTPVDGTRINMIPTGYGHNGYGFWYHTQQNIQAFSTTFSWIPNGQNFAFTIQNTSNNTNYQGTSFASGAGCEGGFYQAYIAGPPNENIPNNLFALEFDQSSLLNTGDASYTNSSVQIYMSGQSPCSPNDSGPGFWPTTKFSTSPVAMNSPANNKGVTTGDTYTATVSYDGSNLNLCFYDATAGNGSCSTGSTGTGTYYQHTWQNVRMPSLVGATTALIGFVGGVGPDTTSQQSITQWSYTVNTSTASPGTGAPVAGGTNAANPIFSPGAGTYSGAQSVTLSSATTSGAYFCYALGAAGLVLTPLPDNFGGCAVGTLYSGAVPVSASQTLYAVTGISNPNPSLNTYEGNTGQYSTNLPSGLAQAAYTITTPPPTCPVSAGASWTTIKGIITGCASPGTVTFAAGTYTGVNSTVTVPCGVSLSGPVLPYSQSHYQTAILQESGGITQPIHTTASCPASQSISYLEWNGEQSSGGGGFIYVTPGTQNLTIDHNWIHGMTGGTYPGCCNEVGIIFAGNNSSPLTQNDVVTLNEFGPEVNGQDCGAAMTETATEGGGGFCNGWASNGQLKNVTVSFNRFQNLEQGAKVAEACSNCGTSPSGGNTNNLSMDHNHFDHIQRIPWESQSNWPDTTHPTLQYTQYNDFGERNAGGGGQQNYDVSSANGCSNNAMSTNCPSHVDYNVDIQYPGHTGVGFEIWGGEGTTANYNLIQGYSYNGLVWAPNGDFTFTGNILNIVSNGSGSGTCTYGNSKWFNPENNPNPPAYQPTCTSNTLSNAITGTYPSATPVVSPSSTSFTTAVTVTMTNPGTNRDTNTTIWCTTDGSSPVPGSGTTLPYASSATLSFSTTTTLKCVGMWGAINQPYSYPSGYGYVPSAVVTNTYTAGSPPTLNSVTLASSMTSIAVGATTQLMATCHYSNGVNTSCNTTDAFGNAVSSWASSATSVATVNASGLVTGVALGSATMTATAAGVTSNPGLGITVATAPVTLTSVTLAGTGGATSLVAGGTLQLVATCHYSDGSTTTCTTADVHGNGISTCASSSTSIATVTSPGCLVTGVAAGTSNLTAVAGGITSSPALMLTVTAAPPTLTGGYLGTPGGVNTLAVGSTLQFSAFCQYNTTPTTTTNCSVADIYGNAVTSWTSSSADFTIGQVGSANPGLATGVAVGGPSGVYALAHVGSVVLNQWNLTITAPAVTLTGVSLATTGGVTGIFAGGTNQLIATCSYSDGSTTNCTSTDSHGNVAGTYASSQTSHATVSSGGLVTAVAAGFTSLTAHAGTFTSPGLGLTVLAVPSGVYAITISGPVKFSGTVKF